jgi:hypothetical protein
LDLHTKSLHKRIKIAFTHRKRVCYLVVTLLYLYFKAQEACMLSICYFTLRICLIIENVKRDRDKGMSVFKLSRSLLWGTSRLPTAEELTEHSLKLTGCSLKWRERSLKLTERSLKLTECSLKLTERSPKLTEHSFKLTESSLNCTECSLHRAGTALC